MYNTVMIQQKKNTVAACKANPAVGLMNCLIYREEFTASSMRSTEACLQENTAE
jgi:hypothetical protein